jgi:heptaprenyl diphosphate synthase
MSRFGLPEIDPTLEESLGNDLALVEELLTHSIEGKYPFVVETSRHLVAAGGKRLRPLLALLASHCGPDRVNNHQQILEAAAVCELTHLATLYHDDVMDEAERRRGVESANVRWGNTVAILTGDYLFAKASQILAGLGPEAVALQAHTFERLVIGQINEGHKNDAGLSELEHYMAVIADKTGSLIAASARYGALFSGCSLEVVEALTQYGEEMGLVFQLADDIIDIASTSAESGKTQGTDLREGVPTLVTLLILESNDAKDAELRARLSAPIVDDALVAKTIEELRTHPALDEAKKIVKDLADKANNHLAVLSDGVAKTALIKLTNAVISRTA